jgi:23S rRNA (adenine2030-N6)-methyltransferase
MNYRHHFHAGSFSDVFKHIILACLLEKLQEKETALTYLDTHAGRGLYYLHSTDAQKLREYQFGIEALLNYVKDHPPPKSLQRYLDIVGADHALDPNKMVYPGSPKIAEAFMRQQDKMILCELHPEELSFLKENMPSYDALIAHHHIDAYAAMRAFLPPKKTPRGLVMIDPPFEQRNEFAMIEAAIQLALKHWRQGHYMVWYPIKDKREVTRFQNTIKNYSTESVFFDLLVKNHQVSSHLMGCGVALINPPWKLAEILAQTVIPYLEKALQSTIMVSTVNSMPQP